MSKTSQYLPDVKHTHQEKKEKSQHPNPQSHTKHLTPSSPNNTPSPNPLIPSSVLRRKAARTIDPTARTRSDRLLHHVPRLAAQNPALEPPLYAPLAPISSVSLLAPRGLHHEVNTIAFAPGSSGGGVPPVGVTESYWSQGVGTGAVVPHLYAVERG